MKRVQEGQRFRFASSIEAVIPDSLLGRWFMSQVDRAKSLVVIPNLLEATIRIEPETVFVASLAYESTGGWAVRAKSENGSFNDIWFLQSFGQPGCVKDCVEITILDEE